MEYGKLIELLNEYERSKGYEGGWEIKNGIPYFDDELPKTKEYISVLICAKPYGFIKWLVNNNKIDIEKLKDNISFTMITHSIGVGCDWRTVKEGESIIKAIGTNAIIAYLSIQDNPIDFLISILN